MVTQLHDPLIYFDLISWDLAIDEKGYPLVIELNLKDQRISSHQGVMARYSENLPITFLKRHIFYL